MGCSTVQATLFPITAFSGPNRRYGRRTTAPAPYADDCEPTPNTDSSSSTASPM